MTYARLTGKDNPLLKTLRKLNRNPGKNSCERMAIEGIRALEEAENYGCAIEAAVIAEGFGKEPREENLLERWRKRGIRIFQVSENLFSSISAVRTPQGAMALGHVPQYSLEEIQLKENILILCASGIQDPGNLGTLIRTGSAAGADMVLTTTETVSARNPKTLRASAGAFFSIPVVEHIETGELRAYCERNKIRMYRAAAGAGVTYTEADLACSCAIFLGNEGAGVNKAAFACLPAVHIPMRANTESLNVAAAGAILLFEAARQRSGQIQRRGDETGKSRAEL